PTNATLFSDFLRLRTLVALCFLLTLLSFLDYVIVNTDLSWVRLYEDREFRKSMGIGALLCLALLMLWLVTRVEYVPGHGFFPVQPRVIGGDEPHYLIMINSLLFNHSLHVESEYDDVEQGG